MEQVQEEEEEKFLLPSDALNKEQDDCPVKRARRLKRIQVSNVFDPLAVVHGQIAQICQNDFEYEYKCSICLEQLSERTQPDSCRHDFCLECIFAWTRYSDICPLCKVKITNLKKFDPLCPTQVTQTFLVEPKRLEKPKDDYVIEFADNCYICQQMKDDPAEEEATLMVCDGCDYNLAHFQCAGKRVFPTEEWFCFACVAQAREQAEIDKLALKLRNKIRNERRKAQLQCSSSSKSTSSDTLPVQQITDLSEQLRKNQIFGEESEDDAIKPQRETKQDDSLSVKPIALPNRKEKKLESRFERQAGALDCKKRIQKSDQKAVQGVKSPKFSQAIPAQPRKMSNISKDSFKRDKLYKHSLLHINDQKNALNERQGIGRRGELAAAILKIQPGTDNAKVRARLPQIQNGQILGKPQQRPPQFSLDTLKPDIDIFGSRSKLKAPDIPIQKLKPCFKEKVQDQQFLNN